MRTKNLAGMLKTAVVLAAKHAPVNQISLPGITESDDPMVDTRLFVSNENLKEAYESFMTGKKSTNPDAQRPADRRRRRPRRRRARRRRWPGWSARAGWARTWRCSTPRSSKMPFYFPGLITNRSQYVREPLRIYKIKDEDGKNHNAYRLVLSVGENGEYWGVQGMSWKDPPILASPDRIRKTRSGRELLLFYDGSKLMRVGWKTPRALVLRARTRSGARSPTRA